MAEHASRSALPQFRRRVLAPTWLASLSIMRHYELVFDATVDKSANLLKVAYTGRVRADEAKACAEQIRVLLRDIQPGFRLLTDFRTLESMDLDCVPFIEKVMDWCDDAGVQKVVRIMPDPHKDIGLNIMSLFHYGRAVRIVTCQTLEDARRALAG